MFLTIAAFIVVIGVLIFVHELGHFLAAKALGVQVLRFSLGIGPPVRALSVRRGETEYCLSWLPIGGYVSMATLEEQGAAQALEGGAASVQIDPERVFERRPVWARAIILLAGVTMNAVFAVIAFAALAGTRGVDRTQTTQIDSVWVAELPAGAAALGTLQRGDRIVAVNGASITSWEELLEKLFTLPPPVAVQIEGRSAPLRLTVPLEEAARIALVRALDPFYAPVIDQVIPGDPAQRAGLQVGDRVVAANGVPITSWLQFTRIVRGSEGRPLSIEIERGGARLTLALTPERRSVTDPHTEKNLMGGYLGVGPRVPVVHERFGIAGAVAEGTRRSVQVAGQVLGAVFGLVTGRVSVRELGGPIRIGQVSGEAARLGVGALVTLMAVLSINLAILNLLPIPVLDGGGLLFLLAEAIRRKPFSVELRARLTNAGLIVVAAIMLFAISNDVFGLFRR
jgi:regulator of sigma E protease